MFIGHDMVDKNDFAGLIIGLRVVMLFSTLSGNFYDIQRFLMYPAFYEFVIKFSLRITT
jgi:hypothetical protein